MRGRPSGGRRLGSGVGALLLSVLALVPALALRRGAAAPPEPAATPARRVVLLSLDGAGAGELFRRYRAGELRAGGFARFFAAGQVARGLVPPDPSLTAPVHVTYATGFPPGATGIVSNRIPRPGGRLTAALSGFEAPVETETLWEAARRQGRQVGAATWPGADGSGPRRRGDWGLAWSGRAFYPSRLLAPRREHWRDVGYGEGPGPSRGWSLPPGLASHSRPLTYTFQVSPHHSFPHYTFDLVAVDRTDDGAVNYDGLLLSRDVNPAVGAVGILEPGRWMPLRFRPRKAGGEELGTRIKLVRLDPELREARILVAATHRTEAYPEAYAESLVAAGLEWPGGPSDGYLAAAWRGEAGIDLGTWLEEAERFSSFLLEALLVGMGSRPWDLALGYLPAIDQAGHLPSPGPGTGVEAAQRRLWQVADAALARLLDAVDLRDTAVFVVSDHGMLPVRGELRPNVLLREAGWLAIDPARGGVDLAASRAYALTSGPVAHVVINVEGRQEGGIVPPGEVGALAAALEGLFSTFEVGGERAFEAVVPRRELGRLGLDHPRSGDLFLIARPGYTLSEAPWEASVSGPAGMWGMHGYLRQHPEMRGIFLGLGAGVTPGRRGQLDAGEVARMVAARLGIDPPRRRPSG